MTKMIVTETSIAKQVQLERQARLAKQKKNQDQLLKENRRRVKKHNLKTNYGLTIEQYDEMVRKSGGRCMVCGKKPTGKKGLHVDHDHKTGKVRGLLCNKCNVALGMVNDTPNLLLKLYYYLRSHA